VEMVVVVVLVTRLPVGGSAEDVHYRYGSHFLYIIYIEIIVGGRVK